MSKKFGIILSGCGVFDGTEIHEAVHTMTAIAAIAEEYICLAPDNNQMHVIDHQKQVVVSSTRNILTESARIARGMIKNLKHIHENDFDILIFVGGFGAAKNLCDFAVEGNNCSINQEVFRIIKETYKAKKPIGAMCIAPVVLAKAFEMMEIKNVNLTIGNDKETAEKIELMGAKHIECEATEVCIDIEHRIVTTPAYMLARHIYEIKIGTENLVKELMKIV